MRSSVFTKFVIADTVTFCLQVKKENDSKTRSLKNLQPSEIGDNLLC